MDAMDTFDSDPLIQAATAYVKSHMAQYDASHDWNHIQRVVGLARYIYSRSGNQAVLDLRVIHLAALLHDVGDRKYVTAGSSSDPSIMVSSLLLSNGAPPSLAANVQAICLGVSYSSEIKDPAACAALVATHPELGVVQDADRLDAIGAVGIGRVFSYGAARTDRPMSSALTHFDEKLLRLEAMAKTPVGRALMRERTERLQTFKEWWSEEVAFAVSG